MRVLDPPTGNWDNRAIPGSLPMEPQEPRRGGLILSILGRLSVAVLLTLCGLIIGAFIGAYLGFQAMTSPPPPPPRGFETEGVGLLIVFVIDLLFGAAGGAIVGLVIGVVVALLMRRKRDGGLGSPQ